MPVVGYDVRLPVVDEARVEGFREDILPVCGAVMRGYGRDKAINTKIPESKRRVIEFPCFPLVS